MGEPPPQKDPQFQMLTQKQGELGEYTEHCEQAGAIS